jgi:hypothetical protein
MIAMSKCTFNLLTTWKQSNRVSSYCTLGRLLHAEADSFSLDALIPTIGIREYGIPVDARPGLHASNESQCSLAIDNVVIRYGLENMATDNGNGRNENYL